MPEEAICPNDTNGDGDCGRKGCPICYPKRPATDAKINCPNCDAPTMSKVAKGFKCGICGYLDARQ